MPTSNMGTIEESDISLTVEEKKTQKSASALDSQAQPSAVYSDRLL